jgi:hypothetical protein
MGGGYRRQKSWKEGVIKCSNPDCNHGIGLVAYRRGWFSKRRYCSKHCRDAFVAHAPKLECAELYRVTARDVNRVRSNWKLIPDLA